jgi:branched-subunit amino acid aminotransferase/4-amino-4-deoxychorismate lyase
MSDLSVASPAVSHGVGLFETLLVRDGRSIAVEAHYERMAESCRRLGFALPSRRRFFSLCDALDGAEERLLRILWLATSERLESVRSWRLDRLLRPITPLTIARRGGARVILLDARWRRSLPEHKTTSYAAPQLAIRQAIAAGGEEALFVDSRGRILEGTSSNIFAVRGRTLITAPVSAGILPGTVRAWVVANCPRLGLRVVERSPTVEGLLAGSFITSSLTPIAAVKGVDGKSAVQHPVVEDLLNLYLHDLAAGKL